MARPEFDRSSLGFIIQECARAATARMEIQITEKYRPDAAELPERIETYNKQVDFILNFITTRNLWHSIDVDHLPVKHGESEHIAISHYNTLKQIAINKQIDLTTPEAKQEKPTTTEDDKAASKARQESGINSVEEYEKAEAKLAGLCSNIQRLAARVDAAEARGKPIFGGDKTMLNYDRNSARVLLGRIERYEAHFVEHKETLRKRRKKTFMSRRHIR